MKAIILQVRSVEDFSDDEWGGITLRTGFVYVNKSEMDEPPAVGDRLVLMPATRDERRPCGAEFRTVRQKDVPDLTAMQQWSDHLAGHQPSPAQWTDAYTLIREGREKKSP
jgi:hypothetical protein